MTDSIYESPEKNGSLGFSGVEALPDTDDADFTEKRGYFFDLSVKIRQSVESVYPNPA